MGAAKDVAYWTAQTAAYRLGERSVERLLGLRRRLMGVELAAPLGLKDGM